MTQDWKMQPVSIPTRWAATVDPENVWPEYPRPQMVRPSWQNLNGLWDCAITAQDATLPMHYADQILVPYPLESALSGVKKSIRPDQLLWCRRTVHIAPKQVGERVLLHFGAVDYESTVYVNDKKLGSHRGGYQSFTFDITDALKAGENELVLKVWDPTDKGPNPYGKQRLGAEWAFYTPSSGIWQTVWFERVASTYIERLKTTPDVDRGELALEVFLKGSEPGVSIEAVARSGSEVVARQCGSGRLGLRIDRPRLWSPDDPYLYDLEVSVLKGNEVVDKVTSYFGLRKLEIKNDAKGKPRIYLNGRYTYNLGVADQGFWPDGLYTAPSDAALKFDLEAAKALGFNSVRKHIKIEPDRWYYHADKLGILVWQDMPNGNNDSIEARTQFEIELKENLDQLHNHPSIVVWVLFNEGWGTYDQERLACWMKQVDPSRLINGHSGPYDQLELAQLVKRLPSAHLPGPLAEVADILSEAHATQYTARWRAGDIADFHYYPGPEMPPIQPSVASVNGEHGSFGVHVEGHVFDELRPTGKGLGATGISSSEFLKCYAGSIERLKELEADGLAGSVYFQLVDVETEQQGFFTYDREIVKVPIDAIASLNKKLVTQAKNYSEIAAEFSVAVADQRAESERYAELATQFKAGARDPVFLRRFALMALRQGDRVRASEACDRFIDLSPQPYSKEFWQAVVTMTASSGSKGFRLLSIQADKVNAALGAEAAEKKILEIIVRETIDPYFKDKERPPDWAGLEESVASQFGALGCEAVCGARMMYDLVRADWLGFGRSYVRYYSTAISRSLYPLHSVAYQVLVHVSDRKALEMAIRAMQWVIAQHHEFKFGRYDPSELDTYATLLHKVGRTREALEWQQKAIHLSNGRDREIAEHFEKMKSSAVRE